MGLRVAIPLLTLVPGGMGGSETYARSLVSELAGRRDVEATTFVAASAAGLAHGDRERVASRVPGGASTPARIRTQAQAALSPRLRREVAGADVVHFPLTVPCPPVRRGQPHASTLLDVQHHDLPELFSRADRAYRTALYDRPARRADAVITISEFSKQQIVHHLGIDPRRVHVAHLGVDTRDFKPQLGERDSFVLYPARGWPHKNHPRLLDAMRVVRERHPDLRLVLTGGALEGLGELPPWVERRGLVGRDELLRLYREAAALVFPSKYEGFGLPPLEAMASGCPVAAASSGSLPEVCGEAAVFFDADDTRAMASAVISALADAPRLSALGLEQVRRFTWASCADVHVEVYRALATHAPSLR